MLSSKKIITGLTSLLIMTCAMAQSTTHIVKGTITEKVIAQILVSKLTNNKYSKVAEYKLLPGDKDFAFAIPNDSASAYRLQFNLYKPAGRHPKLVNISVLPLTLNHDQNYTLIITPSKFDTIKKKGWELKKDVSRSSLAVIRGKVINARSIDQVALHKVVDGALVSNSSFTTNKEGEFEIPCDVKQEGFYYLSTLRWQTRVYLKPADRVELNIDQKTGALAFTKGSVENKLLYDWQHLISPITDYGYNLSVYSADSAGLDAYMATYEKLRPSMDGFIENFDMTDARTAELLQNAMRIDRELAPLNYLFQASAKKVQGFRLTPKDFNVVPALYKQFIQSNKFNNASLLLQGEARRFMNLYAKMNLALLPKEKREALRPAEKLELMMNTISNDTLKTFFFNDQMGQIEVNNLSEFRETFVPFKKYAKDGEAKSTYESIYSLFSGDTAYLGKSAYNFSLPDTSGKAVSMKNFKGKVVFIDVWATWCGPCKAQFPFLREIEEEYHDNKALVFVGISLDKAEVKQKWQAMIKKESLGGIQLLDDFGKTFGRKYDINAIPRFMLIDKQGKWIEIRCPMPEMKERLRKYLDKALAGEQFTKN
jgi:thiol-disulfide isomerase/thioredoxin